MTANSEQIVFETTNPRIQHAYALGASFYDVEHDQYFALTRVECVDGIYRLYGMPMTITELADDDNG